MHGQDAGGGRPGGVAWGGRRTGAFFVLFLFSSFGVRSYEVLVQFQEIHFFFKTCFVFALFLV